MSEMKWDIPINFTVVAKTEQQAEHMVKHMIRRSIRRYGLGELIDFDFFEFIGSDEDPCTGCRNDY